MKDDNISNEKIRNKLFELSDEEYKKFHSKLCPGTEGIIGVRVPILRKYAKEIAKEDWKEYLENAKSEYYEEIMLQGMVIGLANGTFEEKEGYIKQYVKKIDNWAICDVFCAGLKLTNKYYDEMWNFIQKYLSSKKEFELRFAIVMMLDYYITEEYVDKVLKELDKIQHDGYYVKIGVAWAISIAYIKFPQKGLEYLRSDNNLDDFTYNKSIQKIIESYRVTKEEKEVLRNMKKMK